MDLTEFWHHVNVTAAQHRHVRCQLPITMASGHPDQLSRGVRPYPEAAEP